MNNKILLISVALIFVLVSGIIYFTYSNNNGLYYAIEKKSNSEEEQRTDLTKSSEADYDATESVLTNTEQSADLDLGINDADGMEATITVYLYGCIKQAGVYTLSEGARVYEALKLAGGMTAEAAIGYVNLARLLEDGESIFFPNREEAESLIQEVKVTELNETSPLININTATKSELMTLPGIGEVKAASIVSYRENTGKFSNLEDLMKVAGIKESLFQTVRAFIRVN